MVPKKIFDDIVLERERQERLKLQKRFQYTLADPEMNDYERLAAIVEEVGEVSTCILEESKLCADSGKNHNLRAELIQVAACCVAFVEHLDKKAKAAPKNSL